MGCSAVAVLTYGVPVPEDFEPLEGSAQWECDEDEWLRDALGKGHGLEFVYHGYDFDCRILAVEGARISVEWGETMDADKRPMVTVEQKAKLIKAANKLKLEGNPCWLLAAEYS